MKHCLVFLCAMLLVFGVAGVAGATSITITDTTMFGAIPTDTDPYEDYHSHNGVEVNFLSTTLDQAMASEFDYVKWTHHFEFDPEPAEIVSGTISLHLTDDNDDEDPPYDPNDLPDPPYDPNDLDNTLLLFLQPLEFASGYGDGYNWNWGEVDDGWYDFPLNPFYLADGEFTVNLICNFGDFYIHQSVLQITYNPVPEPATMLLLGSGLIGLAGFRKKFRKTK